MFQTTTKLTPDIISKSSMFASTPTSSSAPIPIKQRHRSSFSQTRKRRPSESTPRLGHPEDRDRLTSSKLQVTSSPAVTTTTTFTTTPSGALALSLSPPGLNSRLSKSAPSENEGISGQSHRRRGTTFKCETCSKVYRHPSCLVKHRWEHSPHWHEASKFLLSKHQQVQLLEAAAILSHLSPATAGGTSLPEDRSLWPSYLSGGLLPLPPGHPSSPNTTDVTSNLNFNPGQGSLYSVEANLLSGGAGIDISPGTASPVVCVKLEASLGLDVTAGSEGSTSEEECDNDAEIEDAEIDEGMSIDVGVDIHGDDDGYGHGNGSESGATNTLPGLNDKGIDSRSVQPTILSTSIRTRTITPGSSATPSKSSTPLPGTTIIPARAGLTEIRPGLLGHPNVSPSSTPTPSEFSRSRTTSQMQNGGVSATPSPWIYRYTHPSSNGYSIVSQSSVTGTIPTIHPHPHSMSAPLSVPPFSQWHDTTSYLPSPHHYALPHSYSPVGSISGPFSSLSLSSFSRSKSVSEDDKQTKGLGLPRSSVRSNSESSDDEDGMVKDRDMNGSILTDKATKDDKHVDSEPLVNAHIPGGSGEWEMEI